MNDELPCAIYVAYRRTDCDRVDDLLALLGKHLGPPPTWAKSWFFVDRRELKTGDPWRWELSEAHRRAACVLGIISEQSVPKTGTDYLRHAVYFDELERGQSTNKLKMVLLDDVSNGDLPLGYAISQSFNYIDAGTSDLAQLAATIRSQVVEKNGGNNIHSDAELSRRKRWAKVRKMKGLVDQLVMLKGVRHPTLFRPIYSDSSNDVVQVSSAAIDANGCTQMTLDDVVCLFNIFNNEGEMKLRLLWSDEAREILVAPENAVAGWQHPFDLALAPNSPPVWVADVNGGPPSAIASGGGQKKETDRAALWLAVS